MNKNAVLRFFLTTVMAIELELQSILDLRDFERAAELSDFDESR